MIVWMTAMVLERFEISSLSLDPLSPNAIPVIRKTISVSVGGDTDPSSNDFLEPTSLPLN